jgi:hypothetical protein
VLWFERQVVRTLMRPTLPEDARAAVEAYVDRTLRSMPEHLRAGVAAESILFGAVPWFEHVIGRAPARSVERRVARWKTSAFDPLRQYVRLLHSLVLFAENELVPAPA